MDALHFLDFLGFIVGLVYLYLEYRASIWLWLASIVMPAIDMMLYYKAGLYADFGLAIYYCLAAIYGWVSWQLMSARRNKAVATGASTSDRQPDSGTTGQGITHYPLRLVAPSAAAFALLWWAIWWLLSHYTNSTVPVTDAFTTALSIVALWALAHKYAEQWLLWLVVDAVCCALYVYKGISFKAGIYGLYTVVAVFGYVKWVKMCPTGQKTN